MRVVDPSVDPDPLTPEDWVRRVDPSGQQVKVEIAPREQYYPEDYSGKMTTPVDLEVQTADEVLKNYSAQLDQVENAAKGNTGDAGASGNNGGVT
jgi:hypothetical protein